MTDDEKRQIIVLRRDGLGYGKIAQQIGISVNTVKSFCSRSNLVRFLLVENQCVNAAASR
jgi:DNA-binding NarL/FixJ family response regulator